MLTPSFDVVQDDTFVILSLRVPYVKISDAEIYFEGNELRFFCKPYFLHLCFPGELASDGHEEKSSYDVDSGIVLIHLPKKEKGQFFPNLGMLTTLLPRKPSNEKKSGGVVHPVMEVLEGKDHQEGVSTPSSLLRLQELEEEAFDWQVEQTISPPHEYDLTTGLHPYGFARKHCGVFSKLQEAASVVIDCPDPDHMTSCERKVARVAHEEASFSQDHYLADFMDNDHIKTLLEYEPPWTSRLEQWRDRCNGSDGGPSPNKEAGPDVVPFSSAQRDQLKGLSNREYILDKAMKRCLYLGLVDIVFAYAYQHRTTEGEATVESSWTLCRLSSTLCWLEEFRGSVYEVIHASLRRSLCYPLYRHWQLAQTVLQDTRNLFSLGRRQLLTCVLECIGMLNNCDPYYLLNDLYLTDYAIWLQGASVKQIQSLAEELKEVKVEPGAMGWELEELEEAALLVSQEQQVGVADDGSQLGADGGDDPVQALTNQMQQTNLQTKPLIEVLSSTQECCTTSSGSDTGTSSVGSGTDDDSLCGTICCDPDNTSAQLHPQLCADSLSLCSFVSENQK